MIRAQHLPGYIKALRLHKSSLPFERELFAGLLFLDISGFTAITERASSKGRYGVEMVTEVINSHFESVARICTKAGGEIFKYGGDSCLVVFPRFVGLKEAEELCSSIMESSRALDEKFKRKYGIRFAVHGSFSCGKLTLKIVGDPIYHLDYFVDGAALLKAYSLAEGASGIAIAQDLYEQSLPPQSSIPTSGRSLPQRAFLPLSVQEKLAEEAASAELRNAAVVFIQLMPEGDFLDTQTYNQAFLKIQSLVYRYEGVVNKIDFTDKGYLILLLFGAPILHADDIERAFICATRISQLSYSGLKLRIGINYSNIFVGKIGAKSRWEYGIIGNAVNIAARLMSFAEGGQICVSEEIVSRIGGKFETELLASTKVKGIKDEIRIHRLVRELPREWNHYRSEHEARPFCVGIHSWDIAESALMQNGTAYIAIEGASGSGKSYLIWRLCRSLERSGYGFQIFHTDTYSTKLRLDFFFKSIRGLLGIVSLSRQFDELTSWMQEHNISCDFSVLRRNLIYPERLDPTTAKQDKELVNGWLFAILDALYPVEQCLVFDPLDHHDEQSLSLIKLLIQRNLANGSKVIVSCEDASTWRFDRLCPQCLISLEGMDEPQSLQMVKHSLPLATDDAAMQLAAISQHNPAFLSELLREIPRHLKAEDLITASDISSLQARSLIPDSIENLMLSEFHKLSPRLQRFLRSASILGMRFSFTDLTRVYALGEDQLKLVLESSIAQGLIQQVEISPHLIYGFSKSLMQKSIYDSILLNDKRSLHLRIARDFEQLLDAGDASYLESAAAHYIQSGEEASLCKWAELLAEHYLRAGALELSKQNWELLSAHSPDPETRYSSELYRLEILLLQADNEEAKLALDKLIPHPGLPQHLKDRYHRLLGMYYSNASLFNELKGFAAEKMREIADEEIRLRLRIQYLEMLAAHSEIEAFKLDAIPLYKELQARGLKPLQSALSAVIAQFYMNQGYYSKAYTYYKKKAELAERLSDPIGKRIAASGMGNALFRQGKKEAALELYKKALKTAEESGDRNGYSKALLNIGTFHRNRGEYEAALEAYQKSLGLARRIGNLMQESIIIYDIGELYSYLDRHAEALEKFLESLAVAEQIGDESGKSFCYDAIGDNYFKRGLFAEASATYTSNLELQQRINDNEGIAHTYGNLGNIAKMDEDWELARKYYIMQLEILSKVGDLDGSGRSWFNRAMIDLETGDKVAATDKLHKALDLFEQCGADYYIQICKEQLEAVKQL